jgi:hypothetical protein
MQRQPQSGMFVATMMTMVARIVSMADTSADAVVTSAP